METPWVPGGAGRDRPKSRSAARNRPARGTPQAGRFKDVQIFFFLIMVGAVCSHPGRLLI
ncbi:hypothetical protein [Herbidospora sp. NBRC 101105]|uniref:hypothetical protein n=1 Tax=Herbidospora sp. NBRC 101105 TaxID=3032195 RepID=UPI0024A4DAC8|nr:hypothetical protein [Herbidospora sp. NBRC 101105]GLX96214.1 hypothetical protein Hesp01_41640 [Herbidospora sp. NBRC 101105]